MIGNVKLGKLPPRHDPRTLKLAAYTAALPPPPSSCDLTGKLTSLGMMLNDTLGDCTCAAMGHMIQAWTAEAGGQVILPDAAILSAYETFCGYDPANPAPDQGGVELNVLNGWRQTGVAGHKIIAYAALQKHSTGILSRASWKHGVMNSVYYFGGTYVGVALPETAQDQTAWDLVSKHGKGAPGSWGGHAIPIVAYDADGVTVITWGALLKASWDFLDEYMDEAYAALAPEIVGTGKSPEGFDITQLETDLNSVTA